MTENSEPIVRLGTQDTEGNVNGQFEVDYATDTGDALLRHISSGAEVRWNQTESRWELNQPTAVEEFLVDRLNSLEQNFIQLQSSLGDETQPVPGTSHFESVSTAEASVGNAPTGDDDALRWQEGAEIDTVSRNEVLAGATDGSWDTFNSEVISVSFNNSFNSTAEVLTEIAIGPTDNAEQIKVKSQSLSATGFDMVFTNYGTSDSTDQVGRYLATEGR